METPGEGLNVLSAAGKKLPYEFITLSGLIGAGKTTLATALSEKLGVPLYLEKVENQELLQLFYGDMSTYGFALQVDLLSNRLAEQHNITWSFQGAVQDRSFYEDLAFARTLTELGHMNKVQLAVYEKLYDTVFRTMRHPTCVVFLDVPPATALERIKQRGRENEKGITIEYLTLLQKHYRTLLDDLSRQVRVISIDWSQYKDETQVIEALERELFVTPQITELTV